MAVRLETDVIIGGGMAGAFSAYRARVAVARVLLVDRSYSDRSGCNALASGVYPAYMPGDDKDVRMRAFGGPLENQPLVAKSLPVMYEHVMLMDRWRELGQRGTHDRPNGRAGALPRQRRVDGGGRPADDDGRALRDGRKRGRGAEPGGRDRALDLRRPVAHRRAGRRRLRLPSVPTGEVHEIVANATVVCTGPYKFPYLWPGSTLGYMSIHLSGDGIAMMMRAGAQLSRLELGGINLNPDNALSAPGLESLMPSGAKWVDKDGRRFLEDYDPKRMEMTSRASPSTTAIRSGQRRTCIWCSAIRRRLVPRVEVNHKGCTGCGVCVETCPTAVLRLDADRKAFMAYPDDCQGCFVCQWDCAYRAVRVRMIKKDKGPVSTLRLWIPACAGNQPFAERKRTKRLPTFTVAADEYIALQALTWKAGSRNEANWRSNMAHAKASAGQPVDASRTDHVGLAG